MKFKTLSIRSCCGFFATVTMLFGTFSALAAPAGERADAKGYDGIYYGVSELDLPQYGNVKVKVPSKLVVFPDGKASLLTVRYPSGTLTVKSTEVLTGNRSYSVIKPSLRFGLMVAGVLEGENIFLSNPARVVSQTKTMNGKPYSSPATVAYKQGTRESAELERKWAASNTWFAPNEKFKGPICNVDRGDIPQAGCGIIGTFIVDKNKAMLGTMELSHVGTLQGERGYKIIVEHREVIPRQFQPGDKIVISAANPLISSKPISTSPNVETLALPFNPDSIKSTSSR